MKEYQYCVVRVGFNRTGEVLSIANSLEEAEKTAKQFKADRIGCKVYSYQEIKKMDEFKERIDKFRKYEKDNVQ